MDDDCVQDVGSSTILLNVGWNHLVQAHAIGDDDAPILMEPDAGPQAEPIAPQPALALAPPPEPAHVALTGGATARAQEPAAWDESRIELPSDSED